MDALRPPLTRLPVHVLEYHDTIVYRIETNPRSPERTAQLQRACTEITRRQPSAERKTMVYEIHILLFIDGPLVAPSGP